jgi:tRNA G10  N-methylase Trm11
LGDDWHFRTSTKTPLQDAELLVVSSKKLTYRWAAGIIVSNHIAELLIRLSNFKRDEKFTDDINTLYAKLKNRTSDAKLKRFLVKSYRRFEDADKTRNRCAHVNEGEPTLQEIGQSISLARLLQAFVKR